MNQEIKFEKRGKVDKMMLNNIHMNVIAQGTRARLIRVEKDEHEAEMWDVVDAVEMPFILLKHSNINCIDALFHCNADGQADLYSYSIGLNPLIRCGNHRFELIAGSRTINFNCCDILDIMENTKGIKRKYKGLDIFEIKYNNEVMTIDYTDKDTLKLSIVEIE